MTGPSVVVPTEFLAALIKLLDVLPPILEDWIGTTGFGEVHERDCKALADVYWARRLHRRWLAENGVSVESAKGEQG